MSRGQPLREIRPASAAAHSRLFDPNTGQVQARVALGGQVKLDRAVAAAAQPL